MMSARPIRTLLRGLLAAGLLAVALAPRAYNPAAGDYSKAQPSHIRLASWNVARNWGSSDPSVDAAMTRVLRLLNPDILALQEIPESFTAAQVQAKMNAILPLGPGQQWQVHLGLSDGYIRNALITRRPMSLQITNTVPASEVRGVTAALVDLESTVPRDLYAMSVHLKCCSGVSETSRRQRHADALAKWFGDIRTPGGAITLPIHTPAVVMGDFNFVDPDPQQPEVTLRTGDIVDNALFGPDIKGDWDVTDLQDVQPADPFTGDRDTWPANTSAPSSRLDRFYLTDSALTVATKFIVNTRTMTPAARSAAGVLQFDVETASDHLPIALDVTNFLPVALSMFILD